MNSYCCSLATLLQLIAVPIFFDSTLEEVYPFCQKSERGTVWLKSVQFEPTDLIMFEKHLFSKKRNNVSRFRIKTKIQICSLQWEERSRDCHYIQPVLRLQVNSHIYCDMSCFEHFYWWHVWTLCEDFDAHLNISKVLRKQLYIFNFKWKTTFCEDVCKTKFRLSLCKLSVIEDALRHVMMKELAENQTQIDHRHKRIVSQNIWEIR